MLVKFIREHMAKMFLEHPHLKLFRSKFQSENQEEKIAFQYLCDESHKYRSVKKQHEDKMEEIENIMKINQKIRNQNSKRPSYQQKKELVVSRKTPKPQTRVFRNLDLLKMMVRAYFQLEYKKKTKKRLNHY